MDFSSFVYSFNSLSPPLSVMVRFSLPLIPIFLFTFDHILSGFCFCMWVSPENFMKVYFCICWYETWPLFVIEVFLSLWQYELGDFGLLGFFCMLIVNFIFVVEIMICSLLFCGFHHCFHTHVGQYSLIAMQKTLNFSIHFFFKLGYKLGSLCFSVPSINGALELWTLMLLQVLSINSSLQI